MKRFTRFLTALTACIGFSFALSLLAVHAFWIGGRLSHSVSLARSADAIGSIMLLPARSALFVLDEILGTSTLLPEPRLLASVNGVIFGLILYAFLQRKVHAAEPRS